jgi:hypothetical protein
MSFREEHLFLVKVNWMENWIKAHDILQKPYLL